MKATGMDEIKALFRAMGQEMGEALADSMVQAVRSQLPRLREELGTTSVPSVRSLSRGSKVSLALTRPCPVPGCDRPGRGPRFSFLCEVHRDMPAAEREKYRVRPKH